MRHFKTSKINRVEVEYFPYGKIKWKQKKNLFGKVIKEGWHEYFRGGEMWYDKLPNDYREISEKKAVRKACVSISGDDTWYCVYLNTPKEAKEFYIQVLENMKTMEYVPFYVREGGEK